MATVVVPAPPKAALLSSEQLVTTLAQKQELETKLRSPHLSTTDHIQLDQKLEAVRQKLADHYRTLANRKVFNCIA